MLQLRSAGTKMQTVLVIVVGWIALSCTLGPLLSWAFFYSKRRDEAAEAETIRGRRIAANPAVPLAPDLLTDFHSCSASNAVIQIHDAL